MTERRGIAAIFLYNFYNFLLFDVLNDNGFIVIENKIINVNFHYNF